MKTASLSSSLLVRKGAAGPSGYAAPPVNGQLNGHAAPATVVKPAQPVLSGRPQGATPTPKPANTENKKPVGLRKQTLDHNGRVRLSVRFDQDQHTRLQLASVHTKRTMRDLIADAVDHYLKQIAPNVRHGACACLARNGGNG